MAIKTGNREGIPLEPGKKPGINQPGAGRNVVEKGR